MIHDAIHKSFSIERAYRQSPARVFQAHADPVQKRRWFATGEGFIVTEYSLDFRVGGFERTRFRFGDGPAMTYDGVFLDIQADQRIVFAYSMTIGGAPLSASLSTIELSAQSSGARLLFTEHTAFLHGSDDIDNRREGSLQLLERLARELDSER
jgi:uncharacterized protein YndB with AHSA1/START domain